MPIAAYARIVSQGSGVRSQELNSPLTHNNPPTPPLEKGGKGGFNHSLLIMDGLVGSIEGDRIIKGHVEGSPELAESHGITLAEDILSRGAKEILDEVYNRGI